MTRDDELKHEAERIYLRYARELVEGLGFCPWAAQARAQGRVRVQVITGRALEPTAALPALAAFCDDDSVDIGLLVFPELPLDRKAFGRFTAALREADSARLGRGNTIFALADFHPSAEPDTDSPERLIPFIRRSPDPTIQCVRHSALDAVRLGDGQGTRFVDGDSIDLSALSHLATQVEPLNHRVARANLKTVQREGIERIEAMLADIGRDRDTSYGRLGVPPAPWSAREGNVGDTDTV
jgi:hypothetical protein